ncbi:MAG: DoxX family protein [Chitinophagaceae bacterium]|nr:MAG: DoxX family protein [Chitinophagaceae bacterium]
MSSYINKLLMTDNNRATILIRFVVGLVFFSEGIQKLIYPALRGGGRFERIGIPFPEFNGYFVAGAEIIFGLMILIGLFTRFAAVPLIIIMLVALFTTKIPILLGSEFLGFSLRELEHYGLLSMLHESRNDLAMLFCSLFLLMRGGGARSIDKKLTSGIK